MKKLNRKSKVYLAIDLGASSGRVMAARFDGRRLRLDEVHRFPNGGCLLPDGWHWEIVGLFAEIKRGLALAGTRYGRSLVSAGVDTWGVDYGLVDRRGRLLGLPFMYRDSRTDGAPERVFRRVSRSNIYGVTGLQSMFFNTLYQLEAERAASSTALNHAHRLLFTPDLLHYWLSGRMANEYTIASTSQMLDARRRTWARGLLARLGLPVHILGPLVQPGTKLGRLLPAWQEELGLGAIAIVAPGSHDTASAVAAVPAASEDYAYLSSGTWSLLGVERPEPLLTAEARRVNFTNEGGVCGTIRLLKNITGLWLLQECRRIWTGQGKKMGYSDIERLARRAKPFAAFVDPDDASFATPGDMPARVRAFCRATRQPVPRDDGQLARVLYESLALRYRDVLGKAETLTGRTYGCLHIVGGGSRDSFLDQLAADAIQRPVVAGPVEATALGNILVQMIASRDLASLSEGRDLVRASFPTVTYEPRDRARWDDAFARFRQVAS